MSTRPWVPLSLHERLLTKTLNNSYKIKVAENKIIAHFISLGKKNQNQNQKNNNNNNNNLAHDNFLQET